MLADTIKVTFKNIFFSPLTLTGKQCNRGKVTIFLTAHTHQSQKVLKYFLGSSEQPDTWCTQKALGSYAVKDENLQLQYANPHLFKTYHNTDYIWTYKELCLTFILSCWILKFSQEKCQIPDIKSKVFEVYITYYFFPGTKRKLLARYESVF